ncbi:MAG: rod shape-determining protein [Armatimonadetes bacterium]|nr:rod shape-determining protein [Candidatus Hippobium faecium]
MKGKGIVFNQPNVVARNTIKNKVIAIGNEALEMVGRTPMNIVTSRPIRNGVISEYRTTKQMLSFLIDKVCGNTFFKPTLVIAVPSRITQVEKRAVKNCAAECGVRDVYIIEEPWAAAVGSGLSINNPGGVMVADMGGGTTDIAVLSLNGIVVSDSIRAGGEILDELMKNYVKKKYNLLIGDTMAEAIKIRIGTVHPSFKDTEMEVKGRDLLEGNPKTIKMTSNETIGVYRETAEKICVKIKEILEVTPPDLCGDIIERGIYLTGGTSQLHGIEKLFFEKIRVPVHCAENPMVCVAEGCGKALDMLDKIRNSYQVTNS